jgi:hypothetical protein
MDTLILSPVLQKNAKQPPPLLRQLTRRYVSDNFTIWGFK